MSERLKFALANIWRTRGKRARDAAKFWGVCALFALVFWSGLTAEQAGWFGPPSSVGSPHDMSRFTIHVAADGQSTFANVIGTTRTLREELLRSVYSSPDEATVASEAAELPGNLAYAHAVNVCWHHRYGKKSRDTGAGYHWTWWRKDSGGFRFTTTQHRLYNLSSFDVAGVYKIRTKLSYCR